MLVAFKSEEIILAVYTRLLRPNIWNTVLGTILQKITLKEFEKKHQWTARMIEDSRKLGSPEGYKNCGRGEVHEKKEN